MTPTTNFKERAVKPQFKLLRVCFAVIIGLLVAGGVLIALVVNKLGPFAAPSVAQANESKVAQLKTYTRFSSAAFLTDRASFSTWNCVLCKRPEMQVKKEHIYIIRSAENTFLEHPAIVVVSDLLKTIIVSVRGSHSLGDWSQDLNALLKAFPVTISRNMTTGERMVNASSAIVMPMKETILATLIDYPKGKQSKVHSGFLNEWQLLKPLVIPIIANLTSIFPLYDVTFTGHSLGGAIALLGAADCVYSGVLPGAKTAAITIGQPRVGNAAFRELVLSMKLKEISRVVNYNDPVPHLGLEAWGYNHIENQFYVDSESKVFTCDDASHGGEDTNCENTQLLPLGITAHMNYLGIRMTLDE
ncbi:Alpha/Beta hydrolase protein [Obelidium mucronatum]|nr:Alpha/Beta hydrolase protein [Obelidium mucronatum]